MTHVLRSRNLRRVYSRRRTSRSRRRRARHRSMRMRRLRRGRGSGHRRHHPHPHRPTSNGLLHHPRHHLRRRLSHRRLILLLRHRHVRIRPLLSRSRSRRRRARASHRRSRRSRRHRRRHHRSGISHTITPFAHRRSLSRNHPPRPSSTVARIVIAHHESKMTMRAVARMKPESGRASTRPSLARASSIDRSIASRCLRSRRARRSLPSSLERDNHIASHLIPFHSSHRAGGPSRPVLARIASTAPRGRHSTYTNTTPSIKQKTITTRAKKKIHTHKEPDRWRPTAPARARAASTRRSIARESSSRARETSTRPRDATRVSSATRSVGRRVAFDGRGRRRRRADASRANGTARANGARDANARETEVEVRRDRGAGRGGGMRSRNARETRSSIVRGRFAEGVDSME